jgi:prepilin-type processing-associated H-X9-DG protein
MNGEYVFRRQWDSSDVMNSNATSNKRGMLHWIGRNNGGQSKWQPVRMRDVIDGTSNTLFVGEYATTTEPRRTSFWGFTYTSFVLSVATPEARNLIADYQKCASQGDSNPCKRAFGSLHAGGAINFLLTDGSVRYLSPNVDMTTYTGLATIQGGERIGEW